MTNLNTSDSHDVVNDGNGESNTFLVDITEDENDGDFSQGDLSLREAIALTNEREGEDTITFDDSLNGGAIVFETSLERDLIISDSLTIDGLGQENITIDGGFILNNQTGVSLAIDGLNFTGGKIESSGDLVLTNSTISQTIARSGSSDNSSIISRGTTNIINSTIKDSSGGDDLGIVVESGTANIVGSTITNHDGVLAGSGVLVARDGTANIINSTIANNRNRFIGGVANAGGIVNISNSTIANNVGGLGNGGIQNNGTTTITSSILTNNRGGANIGDIAGRGEYISGGNNIISNGDDAAGFVNGENGDLVGSNGDDPENPNNELLIDPNLGELQNNGGLTETFALLDGSPAIDAGSNPNNLETDQRGAGFDRTVGNGTDIGAYEVQDNGTFDPPTELVVSTLEDENDGDFSEGDLSLREAIALSNEQEGADTITFDSSLSGNILLSQGELLIADPLSIDGLGADNLTIDGNASSRIFQIDDGNAETDIEVTIDGVTIANGRVVEETADGIGGGILNQENLTLTNSRVTGNSAEISSGASTSRGGGIYTSGTLNLSDIEIAENDSAYGGGIFSLAANVNITNSRIENNYSRFVGGGLYHEDSELNLTNSTVTGNEASFAFGGVALKNSTGNISYSTVSNNVAQNSSTGGINFSNSTGNISHSTITGNTAIRLSGGGVSVNASDVDINNTTISNNSAGENGGGISSGFDSTTNVSNSTISGNFAVNSGSGIYQRPQLVIEYDQSVLSGNVTLNSTIVAGNVNNNDLGGDGFESQGNNLIGNGDSANSTFTSSESDLVGTADNLVDPKLGELQDNGGLTQTIALQSDSPAIDAGSNPNNLATDQRGEGFDRTVGNGTDIGAYEVQDNGTVNPPTELIVSTLEDESDGNFNEGDFSLREAIALANERGGTDTITFAGDLSGSIILSEGELTIADSVTIDGNNGQSLIIDGNNSDRVFKINDGNSETNIDVTLDGLVINNGNVSDRDTDNTGGGILNLENLTVVRSTISDSSAELGGGIANQGNLTLQSSYVDNNYAFEAGGIYTIAGNNQIIDSSINSNNSNFTNGGIQVIDATIDIDGSIIDGNSTGATTGGIGIRNSTANINNSTISNNSGGGNAGGISSSSSNTTISNSTIVGNSAASNGGIVAGSGGSDREAVVIINNSTITGNSATVNQGGGVKNYVESTMTINNSTITGNFAARGAAGVYQQESFIAPDDLPEDVIISGTLNLTSSIVAENEDNRDLGGDSFNSNGNNLIGNGDGFGDFFDSSQGDLLGTADNPLDPNLGELQPNGGVTETIALLDGSPAIDAGSNPNNLETDQRGEGFARTVGNGTDIGAFEVQTPNTSEDIIGTNNSDFLQGTAEGDRIFGLDGADFIDGLAGDDFLSGGNGNDYLKGSNGADTVEGDADNDLIEGGNGDDLIRGGDGHDRILGGNGADTIDDGAGNDVLFGDNGEDLFLASNPGHDLFTGGSGSDSYVYDLNSDTGFDRDRILDFSREDKIVFPSLNEFADLDTNGSGILDSGDDRVRAFGTLTVLDFSDLFGRSPHSDTITLIGVNSLDADNFIFNHPDF